MPRFTKSVLEVGKYVPSEAKSDDDIVVVTPERLKHWEAQHKRLKTAKQVVPVEWDHATDDKKAQPLKQEDFDAIRKSKKRSAKNTIGHLEGFKVAEDGQSAEITLDIRRKTGVEAAEENTVFVSPILFPKWRDGHGNEYEDVITHVDFVNHPVDHSQSKFVPSEEGVLACALRFGLTGEGNSPKVFRFQIDDDDVKEEDDRWIDDALEEEPDDMEDPADSNHLDPESSQIAAQVRHDLQEAGIAAPDGVDPMSQPLEFLRQLCAALRQKKLDEQKDAMSEEENQMPEATPGQETQVAETAVVTSPEFAAMSLKANAAHLYAEGAFHEKLATRLDALLASGRATPEELKAQKEFTKAVKLSLDADGKPESNDVEKWILSREALPEGAVWDPSERVKKLSIIRPPIDTATGEAATEEEAREFVDEQLKRKPHLLG